MAELMSHHPYADPSGPLGGILEPIEADGHLCPQCGGVDPSEVTEAGLVVPRRCDLCHGSAIVNTRRLGEYLSSLNRGVDAPRV